MGKAKKYMYISKFSLDDLLIPSVLTFTVFYLFLFLKFWLFQAPYPNFLTISFNGKLLRVKEVCFSKLWNTLMETSHLLWILTLFLKCIFIISDIFLGRSLIPSKLPNILLLHCIRSKYLITSNNNNINVDNNNNNKYNHIVKSVIPLSNFLKYIKQKSTEIKEKKKNPQL